jgi:hypothetical protein
MAIHLTLKNKFTDETNSQVTKIMVWHQSHVNIIKKLIFMAWIP